MADARDQHVHIEGLSQIAARASGRTEPGRRDVVVRGDEDDRRWRGYRPETILHLEPAQSAEMDVEHDAMGRRAAAEAFEELFARRERLHADALKAEDSCERAANRWVVIDDTDPAVRRDRRVGRLAFTQLIHLASLRDRPECGSRRISRRDVIEPWYLRPTVGGMITALAGPPVMLVTASGRRQWRRGRALE